MANNTDYQLFVLFPALLEVLEILEVLGGLKGDLVDENGQEKGYLCRARHNFNATARLRFSHVGFILYLCSDYLTTTDALKRTIPEQ